jgi:hypothetical protein
LYQFPPVAGSFVGTLVYRAWHPRSQCLVCYFNTGAGERFKLAAWWKPENDKSYQPRKTNISFADDVEAE